MLLPEVFSASAGRLYSFGRGLALGSSDLLGAWQKLCAVLATVPANARNASALNGFLNAGWTQHPSLVNGILDEAVNDVLLGPYFPRLQSSIPIGEIGAERLLKSVASGLANVADFQCLAFGRASDSIPSAALKRLLLLLVDQENGYSVALEIFSMRLYSDADAKDLLNLRR